MLNTERNRHHLCLAATGLLLLATPVLAGVNPCSCLGDVTGNGVVDGADLGRLLGAWGGADPTEDLDGNGVVNGADLGILLGAWGNCPAAANDHCGNAQPIGHSGVPLQYAYCTVGADTDGPIVSSASCTAVSQIYQDVWYVYEAYSTGTLTLSTCDSPTFDTVIAVYGSTVSGTSPCPTGGIGLATFVGCNDDSLDCVQFASKLSVNVVAGNFYRIRLGAFSQGETGTGILTVSFSQPGESCENPRNTNSVPQHQTILGDTRDNLVTAYPGNCFGGLTAGPTEWIRWQSTCSGVVTISTCNPGTDFDTVVTLLRYEFDGNCWSTYLTCNDDSTQPGCMLNNGFNRRSYLQRQVSPGEVIYILVSGFNGAAGAYELTIDRSCN